MVDDTYLMDLAAKEAWKYQGLTYPNPAVGALISDDFGLMLSVQAHKKAGFPHAEVEVIKDAFIKLTNDKKIQNISDSAKIHDYLYTNHQDIFRPYTLHVTLEPCNHYGKTPPCSKLIKELGFKRVVVGMRDFNEKASGGVEYLLQHGVDVKVLNDNQTCKELLLPFEKWQKSRFIFFKLAMSLNGVIDGGIITSKSSRELVHRFRDRCDLLVIGGNTVRIDRPTLDARLCDGRAPDIFIYSREKKFDKTIPLFGVKNRKVYISDNFQTIKGYKNIMIEGGSGMLEATKDLIDMYAVFQSPNFKKGKNIDFEINLRALFSKKVAEDRLSWFKI